ncbi:hypothetical protein CDIK_0714 [Cucumispora dikerogammari]|nr:hypothetical protein CDIK_0714 [Cucumispora dikerogammari]
MSIIFLLLFHTSLIRNTDTEANHSFTGNINYLDYQFDGLITSDSLLEREGDGGSVLIKKDFIAIDTFELNSIIIPLFTLKGLNIRKICCSVKQFNSLKTSRLCKKSSVLDVRKLGDTRREWYLNHIFQRSCKLYILRDLRSDMPTLCVFMTLLKGYSFKTGQENLFLEYKFSKDNKRSCQVEKIKIIFDLQTKEFKKFWEKLGYALDQSEEYVVELSKTGDGRMSLKYSRELDFATKITFYNEDTRLSYNREQACIHAIRNYARRVNNLNSRNKLENPAVVLTYNKLHDCLSQNQTENTEPVLKTSRIKQAVCSNSQYMIERSKNHTEQLKHCPDLHNLTPEQTISSCSRDLTQGFASVPIGKIQSG